MICEDTRMNLTRKMTVTFALLASMALPLILTACGNDMNLDDFKRERIQDQAGQLQSAVGNYGGVLTSKVNGNQLGWLEVDLALRNKVTPSTDGSSKADEQPILAGEVSLEGVQSGAMEINDSYFDPYTHRFTANVKVPDVNCFSSSPGSPAACPSGTKAPELVLSGHIDKGVFDDGRLEALNFEPFGGNFTLQKNASMTSAVMARFTSREVRRERKRVLKAFSGNTVFKRDDADHPLNLILMTSNLTPEQNLYDLLVPLKTVEVTLNYGWNLQIDYPIATWDQRFDTIQAVKTQKDGNQTERLVLDCYPNPDANNDSILCHHRVASQTTDIATSVLTSAALDIQDPPESAAETQAYNNTFVGDVLFDGGAKRTAILDIFYPRQDLRSDFLDLFFPYARDSVEVSMNFGDNTEQTIQGAELDDVAGTLSGTYMVQRNGQPAPIALDCATSTDPQSNAKAWDCNFFNSELPNAPTAHFVQAQDPSIMLNQESAATLQSVVDVYQGSTLLPPVPGEGRHQARVTMTVTYPARTRQEDLSLLFFPPEQLTLDASLDLFDLGSQVSWGTLNFTKAIWDVVGGELDSRQTLTQQSTIFDMTLRCQNFHFTQTDAPFRCEFSNNQVANMTISFAAPRRSGRNQRSVNPLGTTGRSAAPAHQDHGPAAPPRTDAAPPSLPVSRLSRG